MYSDRMVNGQKPPQTKPSRQKKPGQNPRQYSPRTIDRKFYSGFCPGIFTTKNWGPPRCV